MASNNPSFDSRVFISSRMAELSLDRAVAYRALVAHGWHPVLFEREPQDVSERPRIDRMITQCPQMIGLYYLTLGSDRDLYKPLAPVEYELLGHLAASVAKKWEDVWPVDTRDNAIRLADQLISEREQGAQLSLHLFLKAQRGFDSRRAQQRFQQRRDLLPPTLDEVLKYWNLQGSVIEHVALHPAFEEKVSIYHSTEALFNHVLKRFEVRELSARPKAVSFQCSLHGADFVGLLSILCRSLFERGINIEWIHQTAANGLFLVALTASIERSQSREEVERLVEDLIREVDDQGRNNPRPYPVPALGQVRGYHYTADLVKVSPDRGRARMDIGASDTPGILAAIANVIAEFGLNIEEISLGAEKYLGARQSHIRVTASYTRADVNDDLWACLYNSLVTTIGVYGVIMREWTMSPRHNNFTTAADAGMIAADVEPHR